MSDEFEVCILNADDQIIKTIVFGAKRPDAFSGELSMSKQRIHLDDSIQTIKNKILIELGLDKISYAELHLFGYFNVDLTSNAKLLDIYNEITTNSELENPLTKDKLIHFLSNYWISEQIDLSKSSYSYEDLLAIYNNQPGKKILGRKFQKNVNHLFSLNPFQCTTPYVEKSAILYSSENSVLLDMGRLKENKMYVCLASDVFEYATKNGIDEEYISSSYYPFLFAKGITNMSGLIGRSQELISDSKRNITDDVIKLYETVDMFYNIKSGNDFLPYEGEGIVQFSIGLKTDFVNLLPLDSIFKNIHATINVPFIKYNPGFRRENVYRLYSKEIYTNGRRKPFLDAPVIMRLSKETGKSGEISLYTIVPFKSIEVKLYVDFQKDGSLRVHANLDRPISRDELNDLLKTGLAPVITDINGFIKPIGYNIQIFNSLSDSFVEIYSMRYVSNINIKKPSEFNLNSYRSCLSSLFVVETSDVNSTDGAKLRFKRVDNFQDMNPIDEFISVEKNANTEVDDIIRLLAKEFNLDEETSRNHVITFFTKHTIINDNAGFPVTLHISKSDKKLYIKVDNITSSEYIPIIKTYLDSIIRIFHSPKTTGIPLSDIQSMCKREINFNVIEKKIVVLPPPPPPIELDLDFFKGTIANEETKAEYDDDDDEMFGVEMEGGAHDDDDINPDGMKLKNPNPFQKRIEDRDPELIKFSKDGQTKQFSRTCRGEVNRQPVMLNEMEKQRIDEADRAKGKFTDWNELLKAASESAPDDIKTQISAIWRTKKAPMDKKQFDIFVKKLLETDESMDLPKKNTKEKAKKIWALIKAKKPIEEINAAMGGLIGEPYPESQAKLEEIIDVEMKSKREAIVDKIWDYLEPMKGSYLSSISYSSDPSKKFYYICPRYWSLKTNRSLTGDDVKELVDKEGKQILIPNEIEVEKNGKKTTIPYKSDTVPKGAYIYEFAHPQEHFIDGKYIPHYPGFIKNSKAKYDFPCCFKRDQVVETTEEKTEDKEPDHDISYIAETNKYPIQKKRWGFLPQSAQDFFKIDNHDCVSKADLNVIERNHPCLLRYGVEQSIDQSIIGCFADIYAHLNNDMPVPTIKEMRQIIINAITIEDFISYNNNALSVIFKPDIYEIPDISKYAASTFYKGIDETNEDEVKLRNNVIGAYENFQRFLKDDDAHIDHTYMWDIMTKPNGKLFPASHAPNMDKFNIGMNMVIMEITKDTDHINLICPTNMYSDSISDIKLQRTFILLKQDDFYEPVYLYDDVDGIIKPKKWFNVDGKYKGIDMKEILTRIRNIKNDQCKPKNSLIPGKYAYNKAFSASKTIGILRNVANYVIRDQVVNYHFKTVGFNVEIDGGSVFVPCFPSSIITALSLTFIDDSEIWSNYEATIRMLMIVSEKTKHDDLYTMRKDVDGKQVFVEELVKQEIDCIPSRKVIDGNQVVGFLTKTNQYIKIQPPILKDVSDEIDKKIGLKYKITEIKSIDYIPADISTTTNQPQDENRISTVSRISKESNYYKTFRSTIRTLLGLYENRKKKIDLLTILNDTILTYNEKLDKVETLLDENLTADEIDFVESPKTYTTEIECLSNKCKLELPVNNLVTGNPNKVIYFGKMADELIRFKRVRSFVLEPKNYLNISNVNYKINPDEILLLDSSINSAYLNESNIFSVKDYVKNITYDIAEPDKSKYTQPYSNVEKL